MADNRELTFGMDFGLDDAINRLGETIDRLEQIVDRAQDVEDAAQDMGARVRAGRRCRHQLPGYWQRGGQLRCCRRKIYGRCGQRDQ